MENEGETEEQIDRQTDRQINRQTDRQTDRSNRESGKENRVNEKSFFSGILTSLWLLNPITCREQQV